MKRIKFTGKSPAYIDAFPKGCERSCEGSIHLLPNAQKDVTDDELAFIRKSRPELKVTEVPAVKPSVKKVKPEPAKPQPKAKAEVKEEVSLSKDDVGKVEDVLAPKAKKKKKK